MFRNKAFRDEIMRPVGYRDAQRFRLVTVLIAFLTGVFWFAVIVWVNRNPARQAFDEMPDDLSPWLIAGMPISAFLALFAMSGLPSYFFHPRHLHVELANRAVAMSHYVCAPLAYLPISLAPLLAGLASTRGVLPRFIAGKFDLICYSVAVGLVLGLAAAWWMDLRRLARDTLRSGVRVALVSIAVPMLWMVAAFLCVAVVPGSALYLWMLLRGMY